MALLSTQIGQPWNASTCTSPVLKKSDLSTSLQKKLQHNLVGWGQCLARWVVVIKPVRGISALCDITEGTPELLQPVPLWKLQVPTISRSNVQHCCCFSVCCTRPDHNSSGSKVLTRLCHSPSSVCSHQTGGSSTVCVHVCMREFCQNKPVLKKNTSGYFYTPNCL